MSNCNDSKNYGSKDASLCSKKITKDRKKSLVEDGDIEIVGTRPAIGRTFSPIGRNIEFSQTHRLSDRETGRN